MIEQNQMNFNNHVFEEAKKLLEEIKNDSSTYGEVKKNLYKCESSVKWHGSRTYYSAVIDEARLLLHKEIDAITLT